jgi:hypothetical protein
MPGPPGATGATGDAGGTGAIGNTGATGVTGPNFFLGTVTLPDTGGSFDVGLYNRVFLEPSAGTILPYEQTGTATDGSILWITNLSPNDLADVLGTTANFSVNANVPVPGDSIPVGPLRTTCFIYNASTQTWYGGSI